jgi:hypothetical protein
MFGIAIGVAALAGAAAAPAYASAPSGHAAAAQARPAGHFTVIVQNLPRGASTAMPPRSDAGCVGNLEWDNIQTCIFINGQSTYVSSMKAVSYVYHYPVLEHVQLVGPSVSYNTANYWIDQGQYLEVLWTVNGNVAPGAYCATSWVVNGTGYSNQGTDCQPVTR